MATEKPWLLDTMALNGHLSDLYAVCQELAVLSQMWAEMTAGPRNANDAWVIDVITVKQRNLRQERAAIHRLIHETPQKKPE